MDICEKKMVKYENLLKIIEDYTTKCPATQKIREIGRQGKNIYSEEWGYDRFGEADIISVLKEIKYPNGITLSFSRTESEKPIITRITTEDGFHEELLGDDCYSFFDSQKKEIIDKYGEEGWEFMKQYTEAWVGNDGKRFNLYKKGLGSKEWLLEKHGFDQSRLYFLLENDDRFMEMCNSLHLGNYPNFYSLRIARIHDNDDVTKRIVTTGAGHSSATVGKNWDLLNTFHRRDDSWTIVTLYRNGNNASTGFFMGNTGVGDIEAELHTGSRQKMERIIIDEKNKIIVQEPYKP